MREMISMALVGIGGYGNKYVNALLDAPNQNDFRIAAAIDPSPHLCRRKRMRCMVLGPRDEAYYNRNRWAGALRDAHGNLVLDSPANNACAHYLHNMLYVLGDVIDRSDPPATVTAELYRAHAITNY